MVQKRDIFIQEYVSPCGKLLIASCEGEICLCDWAENKYRGETDRRILTYFNGTYIWEESYIIKEAIRQLEEYFSGKRKFFALPLRPIGTAFQHAVWNELLRIPYGTTISYANQARNIGKDKAIRAVAMTNGKNALSILIPCHRVVGSNQQLTGYAGGIATKQFLLNLERQYL